MRMMIKFSLPVEASNAAIRTGRLQKIFQQLAEDLKPEARLLLTARRRASRVFCGRYGRIVAGRGDRRALLLRVERQDRDDAGDECGRSAEGVDGNAGHHPALRLTAGTLGSSRPRAAAAAQKARLCYAHRGRCRSSAGIYPRALPGSSTHSRLPCRKAMRGQGRRPKVLETA
jgi:hypothetical protein